MHSKSQSQATFQGLTVFPLRLLFPLLEPAQDNADGSTVFGNRSDLSGTGTSDLPFWKQELFNDLLLW